MSFLRTDLAFDTNVPGLTKYQYLTMAMVAARYGNEPDPSQWTPDHIAMDLTIAKRVCQAMENEDP